MWLDMLALKHDHLFSLPIFLQYADNSERSAATSSNVGEGDVHCMYDDVPL